MIDLGVVLPGTTRGGPEEEAVMDNAGKARVSIREAGADDVERVVALNGFVQELHADARRVRAAPQFEANLGQLGGLA